MPANIEIKARLYDLNAAATGARRLADSPPQTILQEDVFFTCRDGRLKLRIFSDDRGELIHYRRPDTTGPRQSDYAICPTTHPGRLRELLRDALGELVVVRKTRQLYLTGQTRIHLDTVDGLGQFLELEVVLRPGQDPAEGQRLATGLMKEFGIEAGDLVPCAYADLLLEKNSATASSSAC